MKKSLQFAFALLLISSIDGQAAIDEGADQEFHKVAQSIVACIEAGNGALTQREFDESGDCEHGINVWDAPSNNPSTRSRVILAQNSGRSTGNVRFHLGRDKACGFGMRMDVEDDGRSIEILGDVSCKGVEHIPQAFEIEVTRVECGEIDTYDIGSSCIILGTTADDTQVALVGENMDLLDAYELDALETEWAGKTAQVRSEDLDYFVEPYAVASLLELYPDLDEYFWWNSRLTLVD